MMFMIAVMMIYLPYSIVFVDGNTESFDLVIDIFFWVDIILSFNLSFKNEEDKYITKRSEIFINYVTGWFILDIIASFPYQ